MWVHFADLERVVKKVLRDYGWPSPEHDAIARDIAEELFIVRDSTPVPPAPEET